MQLDTTSSKPIRILAISGSLRQVSSNTTLLHAAIALFNASPHATHAQAALTEIVTVMSGRIVPAACIAVPLPGRNLNAEGIVADPEMSSQIQTAIVTFVNAIEQFRSAAIEDSNIN